MKHRTQEQVRALERQVITCIHEERQAKAFGTCAGASQTYSYGIAKRLGYSAMLVSERERQVLREMRGVSHRFKNGRAAA